MLSVGAMMFFALEPAGWRLPARDLPSSSVVSSWMNPLCTIDGFFDGWMMIVLTPMYNWRVGRLEPPAPGKSIGDDCWSILPTTPRRSQLKKPLFHAFEKANFAVNYRFTRRKHSSLNSFPSDVIMLHEVNQRKLSLILKFYSHRSLLEKLWTEVFWLPKSFVSRRVQTYVERV